MSDDEISGRGDPVASLELLWGRTGQPKRGPRRKASVPEIVQAAIALADADGLDAVTTRRVAEAVGISPMSFYTHIPGKAELLDLMIDAVSDVGPVFPEGWRDWPWRKRLTVIAEGLWGFYLQHPWVLQVATHRPVLGPKTLAAYEMALSAIDGVGIGDVDMDLIITVVANYVVGAVRDAARAKRVKELTGMSDDEWWHRIAPFLETIDFAPYPVSSRVGPVVGALYGTGDPPRAFRFGLDRLFDGLTLYIEGRGVDDGNPSA